jgi:PAS domain S-box-containing protein
MAWNQMLMLHQGTAMLEATEIRNASILIVDDQEANVMLLEQMLLNEGYSNITTTQHPREVYALHEKKRFDLILLDLQMPDMDGFEVIEALKKIEHASYLPVLVITAQPAHKLRALKAGAKDFVSKPFDFVEVQTRIHNMLEVRLLYRRLDDYNRVLEQTVLERTAELRKSEARFQRFTELSSDWYWEQDAAGRLTQFSGPVEEMLGIGDGATIDELSAAGWNVQERAALDAKIANRQPFLDFIYSRTLPNARVQYLQVSGEPMFDAASGFAGYRGIGLDVSERMQRV